MAIRTVLLILATAACSLDTAALGPDSRCGWFRQGDDELADLGHCWRLETAGRCVAADASVQDSCDLPEQPQSVWEPGDHVAVWCPVWDSEHHVSRMVPAECQGSSSPGGIGK